MDTMFACMCVSPVRRRKCRAIDMWRESERERARESERARKSEKERERARKSEREIVFRIESQ